MSRKTTLDALFGGGVRPVARPAVGSSQQPAASGGAGEGRGEQAEPGAPAAAEPAAEGRAPPAGPVRTGAVAAIGASLQRWGEAARQAEVLQQQLAGASTVVELSPASIDPAPVRDRLELEDDPAFEALVASIAESGQQVPILVRPHPQEPGRYQAAYGHRRLAAAARLGRSVRAIITQLTDADVLLAQAKENSERLDLSFIERARFAARLEEAGHGRAEIGRALGLDKGDLSRFLHVAKAAPDALVRPIGPAPRAGRARWLALCEALATPPARERAERATLSAEFARADSDRRFQLVLTAARAVEKSGPPPGAPLLRDEAGRAIATLEPGRGTARLLLEERHAPGFAAYVARELPTLYERFRRGARPRPRVRSLDKE
jgi:ParB family chromosome partitioning protein